MSYQIYEVNAKNREPLIQFMVDALHDSGCTVIYRSPANEAPFRLTFETPYGERLGIVAYAFLANRKVTKNRPTDEHRFQLKYGSKDGKLHELWQDPYGLYTTLLIGINPDQSFFVSADPVLHNPTRFFISLEFKQQHVDEILRKRWHVWERVRRGSSNEPTEVLVGGTVESFLHCLRFEREALGEDQGHRQLVAEQLGAQTTSSVLLPSGGLEINAPHPRLHALAREFELTEAEVLDLIESAPRLKIPL